MAVCPCHKHVMQEIFLQA